MKKKTWDEFRKSGLLWFVNSILHLFGWCICVEYNDNDNNLERAIGAHPYRCNFRGFREDLNTQGYKRVTEYLKNNIDELVKEAEA